MSAATACWTSEERVAELKKLWEQGLSASQIAGELNRPEYQSFGYVSRNAVIGKIHRMGLSGRVKGAQRGGASAPRKARESLRKVFKPKVVTREGIEVNSDLVDPTFDPEKVSEFDAAIAPSQRLHLEQLSDATCKWPIGDPQDHENFYFCGGRSLEGLPYCAGHCRVAYQPAAVRGHRITISPEEHARRVAHGKALAAANRARRAAQS